MKFDKFSLQRSPFQSSTQDCTVTGLTRYTPCREFHSLSAHITHMIISFNYDSHVIHAYTHI